MAARARGLRRRRPVGADSAVARFHLRAHLISLAPSDGERDARISPERNAFLDVIESVFETP
jgi:hypothetical protein